MNRDRHWVAGRLFHRASFTLALLMSLLCAAIPFAQSASQTLAGADTGPCGGDVRVNIPGSYPLDCSGSPGSLVFQNTSLTNVVLNLAATASVSLGAVTESSGAPVATELYNAIDKDKAIAPNDGLTVTYGADAGSVIASAAPVKQQKLWETISLVGGSLPLGIASDVGALKSADQGWTTENADYVSCLGAHPSGAKLSSCNTKLLNAVGATDAELAQATRIVMNGTVKKSIAAALEQANVAKSSAQAVQQVQALTDADRTATIVAGAVGIGAKSTVLLLGNGDPTQDPGNSSFSFLDTSLSALGLNVTSLPGTTALPASLSGYDQIWWDGTQDLSTHDEHTLETFVEGGGSVYINGDYGVAGLFDNQSVLDIVQTLVSPKIDLSGISGGTNPLSANPTVVDAVASTPNPLTTWTPNNEGTLTGVAQANTLFPEGYGASGAVWDVGQSGGRLAVLMDVNWAESAFAAAPTAMQVAENLGDFLSN